ncbi:hypothetical protein R1sor_026096 [Riccia sorocarpa]|uniref:Cytochrome P450 n=1 Tax=Riccia sorocarpa TaxID=122646 RepID=A0ABD3GB20_9MARC
METTSSIPFVDQAKHGVVEALKTPSAPFITIILAILVLLLVHRIFQKRLKLPPGPRNLPIIGAMLSLDKEMHKSLAKHAEKYRPLLYFRLGALPMLAVQSAEVAEELFKQRDLDFASRAHSTILYTVAKYFGFEASGIGLAPYTDKLKQLRKVCTQELLTGAKLAATVKVNVKHDIPYLTLPLYLLFTGPCLVDPVGRAGRDDQGAGESEWEGFRIERRTAHDGDEHHMQNAFRKTLLREVLSKEFHELVQGMLRTARNPNVGDLFPWLRWMDLQGLTKEFKALCDKQQLLMREIVEDHKKAREKSDKRLVSSASMDFIDILLSLEGEDKLSDWSIMATVNDLFLASTDAPLTIVQWAIIELIRHPEAMAKLQKELDDVVGNSRALQETDFSKTPFLIAVVKETLRLHPPFPLLLPRMNEKQTTLHGYDIPKNTTVFVNVYSIGRDKRKWEKANEFIPERFLSSNMNFNGNDSNYMPFGVGRRQCVAVNMGLLMTNRVLGSLVHAFEWLPQSGKTTEDIDTENTYSLVLKPKHPLVCRAVPRIPRVDVYYDPQYAP